MSALPDTVRCPEAFLRSPAAAADGTFHWAWVNKAFADTKITAMDWDGVVERRGQFLVIETKDEGRDPPGGQIITLRQAHALGCFCIMFVWGKETPAKYEIWYPGSDKVRAGECDAEYMTGKVSAWRKWAERNPRERIDVTFLNRRVATLEKELDETRRHVVALVSALGGSVTWGG